MPLVLAIEPDRRQASQLANLIRTRVGADLVLTDTTAQALDAIGNRVPDLVLVPALLAPQDDSALAGALRLIATAAHVQMLTIPVLSAGASRPQAPKRGVLARLTRSRGEKPAAAGCDPAVFGEQIKAYLAEAAAKNESMAAELQDQLDTAPPAFGEAAMGEAPIIEAPIEIEAPTEEAPILEAPIVEAPILAEPAIVVETPIVETPLIVEAPLVVEAPVFATPIVVEAPIVEPPAFEAPRLRSGQTPSIVEAPIVEAPAFEAPAIVDAPAGENSIAVASIVEAPVVPVQAVAAPEPPADEEAIWLDLPIPNTEESMVALSDELLWTDEPDDASQHTVVALPVETSDAAPLPTFLRDLNELTAEAVVEHAQEQERVAHQADTPADLPELWMPLTVAPSWSAPALEGVSAEPSPDETPAPIEAIEAVEESFAPPAPEPVVVEPVSVAPAALEAPVAAPAPTTASTQRAEWLELIESLRQDVERLRVERAQRPAPAPAAARREPETRRLAVSAKQPAAQPAPKAAAAAARAPKQTGSARTVSQKNAMPKKPVQDEWGFFDPEQCGFAALLSKLQEITTQDEMNAQ